MSLEIHFLAFLEKKRVKGNFYGPIFF